MIYCQLNTRVVLPLGQALMLGQVARVIAPRAAETLPLPCPDQPGVWRITPVDILPTLERAFPGEAVTLLGADTCYVHRRKPTRHHGLRLMRTTAAFLILLLGSALGLAWFHSDVDMPHAQQMVYRLLTGQEVSDARYITVPYIIGVAAGVAVFYALPSRSRSTPMEVKLSAYITAMEQTEGKDVRDG
ncbi:MAG: hypothetical protein ACI4MJ_12160 [Aristaeellaceae bacterium]